MVASTSALTLRGNNTAIATANKARDDDMCYNTRDKEGYRLEPHCDTSMQLKNQKNATQKWCTDYDSCHAMYVCYES